MVNDLQSSKAVSLETIRPSVVRILSGTGHGTGFFVKGAFGELKIVTNSHVCGDMNQPLAVETADLTVTFPSQAESINYVQDLCIVKVPANVDAPALTLDIKYRPKSNENLKVVGHPGFGARISPYPAYMSNVEYLGPATIQVMTRDESCSRGKLQPTFFGDICVETFNSIVVDGSIRPGNSGSPVVNSKGNVVGIIFAGSTSGTGYYIPAQEIATMLR